MGSCTSKALTPEEKRAVNESRQLDSDLYAQHVEEDRIIKLLLLGTGESGKSTIFKQMQILYDAGFTDFEKQTYRHVVRRNVVEAIQSLLMGAERFELPMAAEDREAADFLLNLDPLTADFWSDDIARHTKQLWRPDDPSSVITQVYERRSSLQVPDSAAYMLNNIDRIASADFEPTNEDILRSRLRTSGIVERQFLINNVNFKFLDVGGQRNERRKWIHCFEDVTAVLFIAAISEYDQCLFEEEKENRLTEAIHVFDNICNQEFFAQTPMILFLNKHDLFEEKIKRVPLSKYFPSYVPPEDPDLLLADGLAFLRDKFLEVNHQPKDVFAHYTCATDTDNVQRVFDSCRKVILKKNLNKLGLS